MPFYWQPILNHAPAIIDAPTGLPHIGSIDNVYDSCTGQTVRPPKPYPFKSAFRSYPEIYEPKPIAPYADVFIHPTAYKPSDEVLAGTVRGDTFITPEYSGRSYCTTVAPSPVTCLRVKIPIAKEKVCPAKANTNRKIGQRAIDSGQFRPFLRTG
jgi:hypothetical protein